MGIRSKISQYSNLGTTGEPLPPRELQVSCKTPGQSSQSAGLIAERDYPGILAKSNGSIPSRQLGVRSDGYREIIGVAEGVMEDLESWRGFLRYLKGRGLKGVRLFISDECLGLVEALGEFYPQAQWQRCMVHWYRNVFSVTPRGRRKEVAAMLKAIHGQEDREAAPRSLPGDGGPRSWPPGGDRRGG